jgi:hypothetical protein
MSRWVPSILFKILRCDRLQEAELVLPIDRREISESDNTSFSPSGFSGDIFELLRFSWVRP